MFRVIVAGSRDIQSKTFIFQKLDALLARKINEGECVQIVSGTARGVDQIGEEYAGNRGFACQRFPADWEAYGKQAGYLRNYQMAQNADALVAFWDGRSPGTRHMIKTAQTLHLEIRVIHIPPHLQDSEKGR